MFNALIFALMALFYVVREALLMTGPYPRALWCVLSIINGFVALFFIACLIATVVDFPVIGVLFFTPLSSMAAFCAWSDARRRHQAERQRLRVVRLTIRIMDP